MTKQTIMIALGGNSLSPKEYRQTTNVRKAIAMFHVQPYHKLSTASLDKLLVKLNLRTVCYVLIHPSAIMPKWRINYVKNLVCPPHFAVQIAYFI